MLYDLVASFVQVQYGRSYLSARLRQYGTVRTVVRLQVPGTVPCTWSTVRWRALDYATSTVLHRRPLVKYPVQYLYRYSIVVNVDFSAVVYDLIRFTTFSVVIRWFILQ